MSLGVQERVKGAQDGARRNGGRLKIYLTRPGNRCLHFVRYVVTAHTRIIAVALAVQCGAKLIVVAISCGTLGLQNLGPLSQDDIVHQ